MFLGRLDWTDDQTELTDDNENLITFVKKNPWDVRWCSSLSSWLERKSLLRTSLADFCTLYWWLVWQLDDFQRSLMESLRDFFKELRRTVWHWMNLTEGGQILRPNLLRSRKTLLSVPDIGISSHLRMNPFTIESIFSIIQVLDISATVKCQESLDKTAAIQEKFIFKIQWLSYISITHQILNNNKNNNNNNNNHFK